MFLQNIFKNKKKKKKEETYVKEIPKTVQKTLPYVRAFEDGTLELKKGVYSKTLEFSDVNYQTATQDTQEAIFLDYCSLLNSMDNRVKFQITIVNEYVNKEELESSILLKMKNDNIDKYRLEKNKILNEQIGKGRNDIKKERYITVTVDSKSKQEADSVFNRVDLNIKKHFKKMGSYVDELTLKERMKIFHNFFRESKNEFIYEPTIHKKLGLLTKDIICPDSFEFKSNYMMIGDKFARALFVSDISTVIKDTMIADLVDFKFSSVLTINIESIQPETMLKMINRQITGMESDKINYKKRSLKSGYIDAFIPHELKDRLDDAKILLQDVTNNNQKLFFINILIVVKADTLEQLEEYTDDVAMATRKNLCQIRTLNFQQEDGLMSTLPFGYNRLQIKRTLTTESTAIFMPFTSQELFQEKGMYYGLNAVSKNLILFNRKSLHNGNGFIFGTPGSGKSFAAKQEIINVLLSTDDEVLIIDPEREYSTIVNKFGGEVIEISNDSNHYINPLDMSMNYSDESNPVKFKSEFILSLCEIILGGDNVLSAKEKSIIDRAVNKVYSQYLIDFDKNKMPTLRDLYDILIQQKEKEAQDIATSLELYALGNQSVFANKTNINIKNRCICFDIKDLGTQLKTMGLLIILDAIWNRITSNRNKGVRTWVYIDEIYLLFENKSSAKFLFQLYKRSRKWGAIPTGITQNVEDVLKSDTARTMISNSEFLLLFNQAHLDRIDLAKLLNISDTQLDYITNSGEGQGLLFNGKSIIPFLNEFPKDTELYKMMTTKIDEVSNNKILDIA